MLLGYRNVYFSSGERPTPPLFQSGRDNLEQDYGGLGDDDVHRTVAPRVFWLAALMLDLTQPYSVF